METNEIPTEVLETLFPGIKSKNIKKDFLTIDDGQKVIIASQDTLGRYHGKVYEFNQPKNEVSFPESPKFADEPKRVDFLRWGGQTDSTFREDYNDNLIQMQHTINSLVDDNKVLRQYISNLQDAFQQKQENLIQLLTLVVADYLDQNHYKKPEIDKKLNEIRNEINNFEDRVENGTITNQYFNPSFTGLKPDSNEADYNDDIYNDEDKKKLLALTGELNGGEKDDNKQQ